MHHRLKAISIVHVKHFCCNYSHEKSPLGLLLVAFSKVIPGSDVSVTMCVFFMHHRLKPIIIHVKRKHTSAIVHMNSHSYCLLAFSKSNF